MKAARKDVKRCEAHYLSQADHDRCILPAGPNGHEMARVYAGLGLPVLIHRDEAGREWTINGPFVRQQNLETA